MNSEPPTTVNNPVDFCSNISPSDKGIINVKAEPSVEFEETLVKMEIFHDSDDGCVEFVNERKRDRSCADFCSGKQNIEIKQKPEFEGAAHGSEFSNDSDTEGVIHVRKDNKCYDSTKCEDSDNISSTNSSLRCTPSLNMEYGRRKKTKNFSDREISILLTTIEKHLKIIENKKVDAVTSGQKTRAWEQITVTFNNMSTGIRRTTTQLKNFYDNYKRRKRKEQAKHKDKTDLTASGTFRKKLVENFERLHTLKDQVQPDQNKFDCESNYQKNIASGSTQTDSFVGATEVHSSHEEEDLAEVQLIQHSTDVYTEPGTIKVKKKPSKHTKASDVYTNLNEIVANRKRKSLEEEYYRRRKNELSIKIQERQLHNVELETAILACKLRCAQMEERRLNNNNNRE